MTPAQHAAKRQHQRMRYAQHKAAGQCPRCPAEPSPPGYIYCAACRRESSQALASTWARRYGLRPETLRYRLQQRWDFADAVTTPVKVYRPRKKKETDHA